MTTLENIPGFVRSLRDTMTQVEFAEKCDLSVSYLSDIERGRTMPSLKTLNQICMARGKVLTIGTINLPAFPDGTYVHWGASHMPEIAKVIGTVYTDDGIEYTVKNKHGLYFTIKEDWILTAQTHAPVNWEPPQ